MFRILICSAFALGLASAAQAEPADNNTLVVKVSTHGVDFTDHAQTGRFYNRLKTAAQNVCDIPGDSIDVRASNQVCEDEAMDDAVENAHIDGLKRWHDEATGHRQADVAMTSARGSGWSRGRSEADH